GRRPTPVRRTGRWIARIAWTWSWISLRWHYPVQVHGSSARARRPAVLSARSRSSSPVSVVGPDPTRRRATRPPPERGPRSVATAPGGGVAGAGGEPASSAAGEVLGVAGRGEDVDDQQLGGGGAEVGLE